MANIVNYFISDTHLIEKNKIYKRRTFEYDSECLV